MMNFVFSRDNDLLSAQCWFKIFQIEQNNMKEICKTMTCIERKFTIKKKDIREALKRKLRDYLGIFPKRRTPHPPFWEPLVQNENFWVIL